MPKVTKKSLARDISSLKEEQKTENFKLLNNIEALLRDNINKRNHCVAENCPNRDLLLYYCKTCAESKISCQSHFRGKTRTKICLVCGTQGITRRYSNNI